MSTTPGDLKFEPCDENGERTIKAVDGDKSVPICQVFSGAWVDRVWVEFPPEETEANARLLTASKKLLMAAQKAYSLLDSILALKGTGLEVMGYHQNGEPESFDALIEDDMNGDELQMLADAISAATVPPPEPETPAV